MATISKDILDQLTPDQRYVIVRLPSAFINKFVKEAQSNGVESALSKHGKEANQLFKETAPEEPGEVPGIAEQTAYGVAGAGLGAAAGAGGLALGDSLFGPSAAAATGAGATTAGAAGAAAPNIISATSTAGSAGAGSAGLGAAEGATIAGETAGAGGITGQGLLGAVPGAAGIAAAGINAVDAFGNITKGDEKGKVEGLATLGGTALGGVLGGAVGAGVGSVAGRTVGRGLNSILSGLGVWHESGKDIMEDRIKELESKGVSVPDAQKRVSDYGLSREDLVAREQAKLDSGAYGNPNFAASRDEKDLKPEDTWGGLMWLEEFGDEYLQGFSEEERRAMNQLALDQGIIKEARGQLTFTDSEAAKQIVAQVKSGGAPQAAEPLAPSLPIPNDPTAQQGLAGPTPDEGPGVQIPQQQLPEASSPIPEPQVTPQAPIEPPAAPTPPDPLAEGQQQFQRSLQDLDAAISGNPLATSQSLFKPVEGPQPATSQSPLPAQPQGPAVRLSDEEKRRLGLIQGNVGGLYP